MADQTRTPGSGLTNLWLRTAAPRPDPAGLPSLRSPWRSLGAALAAVCALAWLPTALDAVTAPGLLVVPAGGLVLGGAAAAVALLRRDTPRAWMLTLLLGLIGLAGYGVLDALAVPVAGSAPGHWNDPDALVRAVAAVLVIAVTAGVLFADDGVVQQPQPAVGRGLPWQAGLAALVLLVGSAGVVASSSAQDSTSAVGAASVMSGMDDTAAPSARSGDAYWASLGSGFHPTGVTRTYYVGADEVVWDYAPTGMNGITGQPFDDTAKTYVASGPGRIGSKYLKCLYRAYTDDSFSALKQRPDSEAYLGFTGPVLRAEVGDVIKVVFRNACSLKASVHPHGVFYEKGSEGAPYADTTGGDDKADDAVPTGRTRTYTWKVPDRAGPGPHDGSSVMWMYHSHTDEVGDTYAGLQGFMEITAKGQARPDGSPKDVDHEVFELFSVMNENNSPYLDANVKRFAKKPYAKPDDEEFAESNLMHSVNGYVFGNQPMLTLKKGERVRWYLMGMGTEVDLHTPHWHGNDVVVGGMRMDVVNLLPASMVTADMVPDDPGIWLFHCHVNDHLTAGMVTRYQVVA